MVQEMIRHHDAALLHILGEDLLHIPLDPLDFRWQIGRAGGQVQAHQLQPGLGQFAQESPVPRSQLDHATLCAARQAPPHPAEIPHQPVDEPQVPPAAERIRIIEGQLIEEFRLHHASHRAKLHWPGQRRNW